MSSQWKTASLGSKVHLTPRKKAVNRTFSKSPSGAVSPWDRVISSKMHAIRSLQNELADAKRELVELRKENKLLNRIQIRQEKDLAKCVSSLWYTAPELLLYNMTSLFCFVLYCTYVPYVCVYVCDSWKFGYWKD